MKSKQFGISSVWLNFAFGWNFTRLQILRIHRNVCIGTVCDSVALEHWSLSPPPTGCFYHWVNSHPHSVAPHQIPPTTAWAHFTVLEPGLSVPAVLTDRLVCPTGLVSVCPTYYSNAWCASFIDPVSVPWPLSFSYNKRPHENVWRRRAKQDQLSLIII